VTGAGAARDRERRRERHYERRDSADDELPRNAAGQRRARDADEARDDAPAAWNGAGQKGDAAPYGA
jgi:hypothetical protein